jgi:hypothetical protein
MNSKRKYEKSTKKMISNIKTLAALLMVGAAFTACSSDNVMTEQPGSTTKVYPLTVNASKEDVWTRALAIDGDGQLTASWDKNDVIEVYKAGGKIGELPLTGIAFPGYNGIFTGGITENVAVNDELTIYYHQRDLSQGFEAFESQDGMSYTEIGGSSAI